MALLFSKVTVNAAGEETELLVGGIPREYDDLEGWKVFDDFIEDISEDAEVMIHAEAYIYGEGETVKASTEEIAYFMKRIEWNPNFLKDRCDNIEDTDFHFEWCPDELFGMEDDYNEMSM